MPTRWLWFLLLPVLAIAAPDRGAELDRILRDYGFRGRVDSLRFELEGFRATDTLSPEDIVKYLGEEAGRPIVQKLWAAPTPTPTPTPSGEDKEKEKEKGERPTPTATPTPAPKNAADLLRAAEAARLEGFDRYLLAAVARMRADGLMEMKNEKDVKEKLAEWRAVQIEELALLRPHAKLSELGLPPALLKSLEDKGLKGDFEIGKLVRSNTSDESKDARKKLEEVLSALTVPQMVRLHALLDQKVEDEVTARDLNISRPRLIRLTERERQRLNEGKEKKDHIGPRAAPSPKGWNGGRNRKGGLGPASPPQDPTRPSVCGADNKKFKDAVEEERKKPVGTGFNQALRRAKRGAPGLSGLCGSVVVDTGVEPVGISCFAFILTAGHCLLEDAGTDDDDSTLWSKVPDNQLDLQMDAFRRLRIVQVTYPPPFSEQRPGDAQPLQHDIAVVKAEVDCRELRKVPKAELASKAPDDDQEMIVHMNPERLRDENCVSTDPRTKTENFKDSCHGGILVGTRIPKRVENITTPGTVPIDVRNDCNPHRKASLYQGSIQPGTSGSPVMVRDGDKWKIAGNVSTKNPAPGHDGLTGTYADATGDLVWNAVGLTKPRGVTRRDTASSVAHKTLTSPLPALPKF